MHMAGHVVGETPGCSEPFSRTHFPSNCQESLLYKGPVRGGVTSKYSSATERRDHQTGNNRPQPVASTEFCDDIGISRASSRERDPVRGTRQGRASEDGHLL